MENKGKQCYRIGRQEYLQYGCASAVAEEILEGLQSSAEAQTIERVRLSMTYDTRLGVDNKLKFVGP